MKVNAEEPSPKGTLTVGALIARYEEEEMPERYSTRAAYQSNLDVHIKPRWVDTRLDYNHNEPLRRGRERRQEAGKQQRCTDDPAEPGIRCRSTEDRLKGVKGSFSGTWTNV
jgi:hypothetical protein